MIDLPVDLAAQLGQASSDDFVAVRRQLATDLRSRGEEELADAVAAVRKPSAAVRLLNRLATAHADRVGMLLRISADLASAQSRLLSGDREAASELRELGREQTRAQTELVRLARGVGAGDGPPSDASVRQVEAMLRNAGGPDAERLRAGALLTEPRPPAPDLDAAVPARAEPDARAAERAAAVRRAEELEARSERLRREAERRADNAESLRHQLVAAEEAATAAKQEWADARREASAARRAADAL